MKAQLDKHLPEFTWTEAKAHDYQGERWVGTPKDPRAWPEGTGAEVARSDYRDGSGCHYWLYVRTDVDLVSVSEHADALDGHFTLTTLLKYRIASPKCNCTSVGSPSSHPRPVAPGCSTRARFVPGDVLIPAPGKELLVWEQDKGLRTKRKEPVILSYRHGERSAYGQHNIPGRLPEEQQVTVDRINTRGIFVQMKGEPKPRKIISHAHHGTPITTGWLLVER